MNKKKIFETNAINRFLNKLEPEKKLKVYMIGGGAMCLKKLKNATFDIDLIVKNKKDFQILKKAITKLDYEIADKELMEEVFYQNAVIVFYKDDSRIDIFIRKIAGMLDFSERMENRSETYQKKGNLEVKLASNTDIFLLKSLSDRPKDIPDVERLLREGINWQAVFEECNEQSREGVRWVFFVYEQLCRVENSLNIDIEGKQKVLKKCLEFWEKKPDDFMIDIKNKDKHIPEEYLEDI
jgi:hypothetical protein